jgi:hypothetical protein
MPEEVKNVMPFGLEFEINYVMIIIIIEASGSIVVEALCYKPEGCGFDTR